MRFVWMVFVGLLAIMAFVLPRLNRPAAPPLALALAPAAPRPARVLATSLTTARAPEPPGPAHRADSVVAYGLAQRGVPYVYAGTSPLTGFDCSGFILYTFAHVGVAVPHSTALLIDVGRPVGRTEAQPGDIVVFTGTAATSAVPGHAGIVISRRGAVPLQFVHASSARRESGVKVSQVEGTDYERRFMQVRRVLGPGVAVGRAKPVVARHPAPVAPLPARRVAAVPTAAPAAAPPKVLARRKATAAAPGKKASPVAQTTTKKKKKKRKATIKKQAVAQKLPPKKVAPAAKRQTPATPRKATR